MKPFTEEEWKAFQEEVKIKDRAYLIGVNIFVIDILVELKQKPTEEVKKHDL